MGFGEDVRGELFGKLGVENENDPMKLIEQGKIAKEEGNNQGAKKAFEQALQIATNQAEKYANQNQHRSAAESYYIKSIAEDRLDKQEARSESFQLVIERLLEAGKTAIAFGEDQRGVACATLAGMVALMDDNQERSMEIYSEYLEKSQDRPNSGLLQKLLYSLGYLLDALKNDNIAAISDAQNYISTDLRPMLSGAKLTGFESLLENVLTHTQDVLQSRITMPKIQIGTSLPRDIQFNQLFDLDLKLSNMGDGIATDVEMTLDIPEDIEVVDGETSESLDAMDPNQVVERKLQLRFQTGDSTGEQIREIRGNVGYVDMLGNSHNQYFGPIEIEFTALSRKDEYHDMVKETLEPLEEISEENLNESVPPATLTILRSYITDLQENIDQQIENEEFDKAEFGITSLEKAVGKVTLLTEDNTITTQFQEEIDEIVNDHTQAIREELTQKFEEEKEEALADLEERKDREQKERIEQLKSDLQEQHSNELNELKDSHQSEMQQLQQSHESNLKQGLVKHENKLKEEFKKEKEEIKSEHEKQIQELKSHHQEEIQNAKKELREELTQKYESKIEELENTIDELKSQITTD